MIVLGILVSGEFLHIIITQNRGISQLFGVFFHFLHNS